MKSIKCSILVMALSIFCGCTASYNGMGVDTSDKVYFSPQALSSEEVALVYIFWNQAGVDQYFRGPRTPSWTTSVNGTTNAKLELGSYSAVEVHPGSVRIHSRRQLGGFDNMSDRDPSISLKAEAGEIYFVRALLQQGNVGLELNFDLIHNERDAYNLLYGTVLQPNKQEGLIY